MPNVPPIFGGTCSSSYANDVLLVVTVLPKTDLGAKRPAITPYKYDPARLSSRISDVVHMPRSYTTKSSVSLLVVYKNASKIMTYEHQV